MADLPGTLQPEKVRILLVDDGPEHLLALRAILERPDYELVTARSGEDALTHVLRSSFALILMDVAMPKLDGFETATLIRQREAARRIPILFVSGATYDIEEVYRGYAAGTVGFLAKPLDPRVVRTKVAVFVEPFRRAREIESLRASEASFTRLRESGLLGVAFEAADGTITDANDAFLDLIGHSRDDLLAQRITVRDLIPPERGDVEARAREALRATGMCGTYETEYVRQDGLRAAVLVGAAALALPERGVIRFALDITERKRIEQERARIFRELRASVQARDDFLSIAAHELRNPLSPMLMMVTSLLAHSRKATQPISPAWLVRRLEPVRRAVVRMEKLIDALLDFSRVTVGQLPLALEDVDMAAIAREVVARMHPELERAGCRVSLRADVPVVGRWDRTRLEQVASNLLENAVRYGAGKPIELETGGDEEIGHLSIRDYGVGIAPEDQARIFDRFERLAPVRHHGGFGLGLWVTRQIVEAHGGTIRVFSEPGEGSLFTIELPRTPAPSAACRPTRAPCSAMTPAAKPWQRRAS